MYLIEKLKNVFKSKFDNNEELTDEFTDSVGLDDIVGTTKSHLIGLHNRIENLIKANGLLIKENKFLKEENDQLKNKIQELEKEIIMKSNSNFVYESKPVFMEMPKQEPIRSIKPKRNRNNRKRTYKHKSSSLDNDEKYVGEVNLIKDSDIPKPGSGEKVEFKNGTPIRRRRRRKKVEEIQNDVY